MKINPPVWLLRNLCETFFLRQTIFSGRTDLGHIMWPISYQSYNMAHMIWESRDEGSGALILKFKFSILNYWNEIIHLILSNVGSELSLENFYLFESIRLPTTNWPQSGYDSDMFWDSTIYKSSHFHVSRYLEALE